MLVKNESKSKLVKDNEGSCSQISSAKWNEVLTVYSFLVKVSYVRAKTLTRLYVRVCIVKRIGLNGGHPSSSCLCTLQSPYIVPGLVSTGFIELRIFSDILLESVKLLKMVYMRFYWFTAKFRKVSIFKVTLSNIFWSLKRFSILLI